jgi:hypothetical protein
VGDTYIDIPLPNRVHNGGILVNHLLSAMMDCGIKKNIMPGLSRIDELSGRDRELSGPLSAYLASSLSYIFPYILNLLQFSLLF